MQLRGRWDDAAQDAQDACDLLASRPAAGAAFYRVGEIHRLRGEFAKAEAAYTRANERGRKPQPGLSLLRLAQGQIDAAAASIRGVLLDTRVRAARARCLPLPSRSCWPRAISRTRALPPQNCRRSPDTIGAPLLHAASAHATGAVRLAEGEIAGASTSLREAWEIWRDLETPYEEAQTRLLMAAVCERRGDQDGRRLELDAARKLFTQLGAEPCLARVAANLERATPSAGWLAERAGGAGPSPDGRRQDESRHRGGAVHQREDRRSPRQQHLRQAWRLEPDRRHGVGLPAQPHLNRVHRITQFHGDRDLGNPSDVLAVRVG